MVSNTEVVRFHILRSKEYRCGCCGPSDVGRLGHTRSHLLAEPAPSWDAFAPRRSTTETPQECPIHVCLEESPRHSFFVNRILQRLKDPRKSE